MTLSMLFLDSVQQPVISVVFLIFASSWKPRRRRYEMALELYLRLMETFWKIINRFSKLFQAKTFLELGNYKAYPQKHA